MPSKIISVFKGNGSKEGKPQSYKQTHRVGPKSDSGPSRSDSDQGGAGEAAVVLTGSRPPAEARPEPVQADVRGPAHLRLEMPPPQKASWTSQGSRRGAATVRNAVMLSAHTLRCCTSWEDISLCRALIPFVGTSSGPSIVLGARDGQ